MASMDDPPAQKCLACQQEEGTVDKDSGSGSDRHDMCVHCDVMCDSLESWLFVVQLQW